MGHQLTLSADQSPGQWRHGATMLYGRILTQGSVQVNATGAVNGREA